MSVTFISPVAAVDTVGCTPAPESRDSNERPNGGLGLGLGVWLGLGLGVGVSPGDGLAVGLAEGLGLALGVGLGLGPAKPLNVPVRILDPPFCIAIVDPTTTCGTV